MLHLLLKSRHGSQESVTSQDLVSCPGGLLPATIDSFSYSHFKTSRLYETSASSPSQLQYLTAMPSSNNQVQCPHYKAVYGQGVTGFACDCSCKLGLGLRCPTTAGYILCRPLCCVPREPLQYTRIPKVTSHHNTLRSLSLLLSSSLGPIRLRLADTGTQRMTALGS